MRYELLNFILENNLAYTFSTFIFMMMGKC